MFAVPGWSISTSDLKPQREGSSKQHETSTPTAPDAATTGTNENVAAGQSAKKRKRENGVTKSNVNEMFRQHIEGHTDNSSKKKQKNKEKKKKGKKENKQPGGNEEAQESAEAGEVSMNKKRKKARDEEKKAYTNGDTSATAGETSAVDNATITSAPLPPAVPPAAAKLTPLQQKMRDKLMSARFRHLNETLYTTPSKEAQAMFDANPELFTEYHNGFSRQVKESWPSNPVDGYIAAVRKRGAVPAHHHHDKKKNNNSNNPNAVAALPRRPNGLCTIADLGCGDAQFARSLTPSAKKLQLKVLSFDLQSPDDSLVTKADIANLPVTDGSVDVTIFCLSLMGTNWVSFVEEAWRVLRGDGKGECWVSEVKSRFGKVNRKKAQIGLKRDEIAMSNSQKKKLKNKKKKKNGSNDSDEDDADEDQEIYAEDAQQQQHPSGSGSNNNDDTDISAFIEVFKSRGFVLKQESVDKSNKMFVKMEFVKAGGAPTKGKYAGITPAPAGRNSEKPTQTKKRFIDRGRGDDEGSKGLTAEQEAKVLKPCVYKIR